MIAAIMLIVFVSIAVLGLSTFIVRWYKQIDAAEIEERCIYNAMAGINYALYRYRSDNILFFGPVTIDTNNYCIVSTISLAVDATDAHLGNNNRRLLGVTIRNPSANPIIIDRMVVTWSIGNRTMSQIRINGSTVWTGSATSSPADVNINNTTIPANTTRPIDLIQFNSNMSNAIITLSFVMTDGTATSACIAWPAQWSVCGGLTIKSMGKTSGSNQYRSVQAAYNTTTGNISDYDEINQTVP